MTPKLDYIPLEGYYVPDDFLHIVEGGGLCERCSEGGKVIRRKKLRHHWETTHNGRRERVRKIKTEDVDVDDIVRDEGFCDLCPDADGNPKKLGSDLQAHFRYVHLKESWICPICDKSLILITAKQKQDHINTHSGHVLCLVPGCTATPSSIDAARHHFDRNHKGTQKPRPAYRLLTREEIEALEGSKPKAKPNRNASATIVTGLTNHLRDYKVELNMPGSVTKIRAERLYAKFNEYFNFDDMPGIKIAINSSFISIWNRKWRSPMLVFERVGKTAGKPRLQAANFKRDPQLDLVQGGGLPAKELFGPRSFHRGHMCPGLNYRTISEFVPSHLNSNFVPMRFHMNTYVRPKMESWIREEAEQNDEVYAVHFLIMRPNQETVIHGITIADYVATVMIKEEHNNSTIIGFEIPNSDKSNEFRNLVCDPFDLFVNASIPFRRTRQDYAIISSASTKLAYHPRQRPSTTSSSPLSEDSNPESDSEADSEASVEEEEMDGSTPPDTVPSMGSYPPPHKSRRMRAMSSNSDDDDAPSPPSASPSPAIFSVVVLSDSVDEDDYERNTVSTCLSLQELPPSPEYDYSSTSTSSSVEEGSDRSSISTLDMTTPRANQPRTIKRRFISPLSSSEDEDGPPRHFSAPPPKKSALGNDSESDDDDVFKRDKSYYMLMQRKKASSSSSSSTPS